MRRTLILMALAAAVLLAAAMPAWAGPAPGKMVGAVVNRYGEPLAGASVRVEHLKEGFVVESIADGRGTYVINNLPPGEYLVVASVGKKASPAGKKVNLAPGQKLKLNLVIDVKEGLSRDPYYKPLGPGLLGTP